MEEKKLDVAALGRKVKQYRKEKGYSAEKLSELAGVSKSHINNIETGNTHASAEVLVRIANVLDISVDLLVCDSLNPKANQKARMAEYAKLLDECNEKETRIIVDNVKTLCSSLREQEI